jgi:hypothetical protein
VRVSASAKSLERGQNIPLAIFIQGIFSASMSNLRPLSFTKNFGAEQFARKIFGLSDNSPQTLICRAKSSLDASSIIGNGGSLQLRTFSGNAGSVAGIDTPV